MKRATIQLETLACPSCVQKVEKAITSLQGVDKDSVQILFNASKAKLEFNDELLSIEQIEAAIAKMGYEVKKSQVKDL